MDRAVTHLRVLSFADALRTVLHHASQVEKLPRPAETVALLASQARVLAEDVSADRDQPPFDRATRDGFAVRSVDANAEEWLQVVGQVRAGQVWTGPELHANQAVEIMTGAPVPVGADCVVMVEHVETRPGGMRIAGGRRPRAGENIVPAGSEARKDQILIPSGTRMEAAEIGVAASCGCASVSVFKRPRVAIIPTGDELVEVDLQPLPHQIRNSNSYALAAQVAAAGGEPVRLPIAGDDREALVAAMHAARCLNGGSADLMLLSGGVSMGKYDLVEEVLLSMGAEFFFTGVTMQPGKPVVFGRLPALAGASAATGAQYFFGLPGNPVSTQVTCQLFVLPLLSSLCGAVTQAPRFVQATLAEDVHVKTGLTRFLPAHLNHAIPQPAVSIVSWQGSGDQAANARANCYLVVPADREDLKTGEAVSLLLR